MKKVKQISIDILVDENTDGCVLAEQIARDLENEGNIVLGSSFQADVTEYYKNEKELLEESKEEFEGEEICPYCDHVNKFNWDGINRIMTCKNCGKEILLCSLCNMDECSCGKCPHEKEK